MVFGKGVILQLVISQGTKAIKAKLKNSELKKTDLVDVEAELATAKASIGTVGATVGITDDDLRNCICKIAKNCGLELKNESH